MAALDMAFEALARDFSQRGLFVRLEHDPGDVLEGP